MIETKEQINYEVSQLVKQCPIILEAMKISREEGKVEAMKEEIRFLEYIERQLISVDNMEALKREIELRLAKLKEQEKKKIPTKDTSLVRRQANVLQLESQQSINNLRQHLNL